MNVPVARFCPNCGRATGPRRDQHACDYRLERAKLRDKIRDRDIRIKELEKALGDANDAVAKTDRIQKLHAEVERLMGILYRTPR